MAAISCPGLGFWSPFGKQETMKAELWVKTTAFLFLQIYGVLPNNKPGSGKGWEVK